MKYTKKSNNIHSDFRYYLSEESLFHYFYGHKLTKSQNSKVNYIWDRLLTMYKVQVQTVSL